MPALMSKRPSAALSEIHRELDLRRKLAAVANGRIVKKSSAPPMIIPKGATGAIIQKMAMPIPRKPAGAAIKKPSLPRPRAPAVDYILLEEAPRRLTAPKGRPTPFALNGSGVAKGGIQKLPAPIPDELAGAAIKKPFPPMPHKPAVSAPIPDELAGAAIKKPFPPMPHKPTEAATKKSSPPIPPATAPPRPSPADFEPIRKGTTVCVRTPMGTMRTGVRLFIWLSAVVVADAEDGYFDVMYNGDFPRDNPFRDVRVPRDQVKKMPSSHQ